jgi:hypothetical protein
MKKSKVFSWAKIEWFFLHGFMIAGAPAMQKNHGVYRLTVILNGVLISITAGRFVEKSIDSDQKVF